MWLLLSDDQARLISAAADPHARRQLFLESPGRRLPARNENFPAEVADRFATYTWLTTAWSVFLFFAVMTPVVLGACWLACVWTKWTLPERPWLRAAGAATLPYLLLFTFGLLVAYKHVAPAIGVVIAAPFVLVIALKELMGLRWSATAVTALLLLVAVPVSSLITLPISLFVNNYAMRLAGIDPATMEKWASDKPEYAGKFGNKRQPMFGTNSNASSGGGGGGGGAALGTGRRRPPDRAIRSTSSSRRSSGSSLSRRTRRRTRRASR